MTSPPPWPSQGSTNDGESSGKRRAQSTSGRTKRRRLESENTESIASSDVYLSKDHDSSSSSPSSPTTRAAAAAEAESEVSEPDSDAGEDLGGYLELEDTGGDDYPENAVDDVTDDLLEAEEEDDDDGGSAASGNENDDYEDIGELDDAAIQDRLESYREYLISTASMEAQNRDKGKQRQEPQEQQNDNSEPGEDDQEDEVVIEQVFEGSVPLPQPFSLEEAKAPPPDAPSSSSSSSSSSSTSNVQPRKREWGMRTKKTYPLFPTSLRNQNWPVYHPWYVEPERRAKLLPPLPIVEQLTAAERTRYLQYRPNELKKPNVHVKTDKLRMVVAEINSRLITEKRVAQELWKATRSKHSYTSFQMRPPKIETLLDRNETISQDKKAKQRKDKGKGKAKAHGDEGDSATIESDATGLNLDGQTVPSQSSPKKSKATELLYADELQLGNDSSVKYLDPIQKGFDFYDTCLPCQLQGFNCSGERPVCTQCYHSVHADRCEYVARAKSRPLTGGRPRKLQENEAEMQEETRRRFAARFFPRNTAAENLTLQLEDNTEALAFPLRDKRGVPVNVTEIHGVSEKPKRRGRPPKNNNQSSDEDEGATSEEEDKLSLVKMQLDTADTRDMDIKWQGYSGKNNGFQFKPLLHQRLQKSSRIFTPIEPKRTDSQDPAQEPGTSSSSSTNDGGDAAAERGNATMSEDSAKDKERRMVNGVFISQHKVNITELSAKWKQDTLEQDRAYRTGLLHKTRSAVAKQLEESKLLQPATDVTGHRENIIEVRGGEGKEATSHSRIGAHGSHLATLLDEPHSSEKTEQSKTRNIMDQFGSTVEAQNAVRDKVDYAKTWKPWDAIDDSKIGPSLCPLPEDAFLRALHHYATYYYTYIQPSPDIFESLDLTSQIALGMIVQEVVAEFALKLGRQGQLEDKEVQKERQKYIKELREQEASKAVSQASSTPADSQDSGATSRTRRMGTARMPLATADGTNLSTTGTYQRLFGNVDELSESDDSADEQVQIGAQKDEPLPPGELARLGKAIPGDTAVSATVAKARRLLAMFRKLPEGLSASTRSLVEAVGDRPSEDTAKSKVVSRDEQEDNEEDEDEDLSETDEDTEEDSDDEESDLDDSDEDESEVESMDEVEDSEVAKIHSSEGQNLSADEAQLHNVLEDFEAAEDELDAQEAQLFAFLAGFEDKDDQSGTQQGRPSSRSRTRTTSGNVSVAESSVSGYPSRSTKSNTGPRTIVDSENSEDDEDNEVSEDEKGDEDIRIQPAPTLSSIASRIVPGASKLRFDIFRGYDQREDEDQESQEVLRARKPAHSPPPMRSPEVPGLPTPSRTYPDSPMDPVDDDEAVERTVTSISSTRLGAMFGTANSSDEDEYEAATQPMSQLVDDDSSSEEEKEQADNSTDEEL
ncbi:hypothetical protein BGW41_006622 [Actinomortierella wolfii]|nr:hypothetical protein BGW41_006622 [Actinomortierella wolfii]